MDPIKYPAKRVTASTMPHAFMTEPKVRSPAARCVARPESSKGVEVDWLSTHALRRLRACHAGCCNSTQGHLDHTRREGDRHRPGVRLMRHACARRLPPGFARTADSDAPRSTPWPSGGPPQSRRFAVLGPGTAPC